MLSISASFLRLCGIGGLFFSIFLIQSCSGGNTAVAGKQHQARPVKRVDSQSAQGRAVQLADQPYDSTKQYIYLTFDDGPQPGTMNCYHTIKHLGVRASFFMVGMHTFDKFLKGVVDSIRDGYPAMLLCNHSYSHAFKDKYRTFYHHPYAALQDFQKAEESLSVPVHIARLPGNNAWVRNGAIHSSKLTRPICKLLDSTGYRVMGWDVEWNFKNDSGATHPVQNVATMVKLVENTFNRNECYTRNNLVLLAHDRMFHKQAYADSLYKFVALLKRNPRYVFETVNNYPKQKVILQ